MNNSNRINVKLGIIKVYFIKSIFLRSSMTQKKVVDINSVFQHLLIVTENLIEVKTKTLNKTIMKTFTKT